MTAALLGLIQRLSPGFPVGGYAYSHGLETVMAAGGLRSAAALEDWIADLLAQGSGRSDAILLCHAMAPGADHAALADLARALAAGRERLRESLDQGRAFTEAAARIGDEEAAPLPYPVAVGRSCATLGLPPEVMAVRLQAFAANLVQAAVRFVPLGQGEGQAVLARLRPLILTVAEEAAPEDLEAIGGAALRSDLASLTHETLEVRIFLT